MASDAHATLAHHFDSYEQQREASTLGMWIFLVTEIMFFGGLFTVYLIYRSANPFEFAVASSEASSTNTATNFASAVVRP